MRLRLLKMRALPAVLLLVPALAAAGCESSPEPRLISGGEGQTQITQLDIDGHSAAYGTGADKDGPNGTGATNQVARALGLKINNNSFPGATLQESGTATDGWGKVLRSYPRPARDGPLAVEPLPNMGLIWYGGNDLLLHGPDFTMAKEGYRVIISRHRASAVYEAGSINDASILPEDGWQPSQVDAGQASGQSFIRTTRPARVEVNVPRSALAEGAVVDLGFVQREDTSAHYTIKVDGERHGELETRGPLIPRDVGYYPEGAYAGYVYRIEGLSPERHRIEIIADRVDGETAFDYWQVEPPVPEPVVVMKMYQVPETISIKGFPHLVRASDITKLNQMTDEVVREFDSRVLTVDPRKVVKGHPEFIHPDEIHLSQRGYDAVAAQVVQAIRESEFADELPDPDQ